MSKHRKSGPAKTAGLSGLIIGISLIEIIVFVGIALIVVMLALGQVLMAAGSITQAQAVMMLAAPVVLTIVAARTMPLWADRFVAFVESKAAHARD